MTNGLSAAVAVLAILQSKTNAFAPSTVVIEQYRPPIDKFIIGDSFVVSIFFFEKTLISK